MNEWFTIHDNLALTASFMADHNYSSHEIASFVEKPWKYEDEFKAAKDEESETA